MTHKLNPNTCVAFFTSFAVCCTLLGAGALHAQDDVAVAVLPDSSQTLVLHLQNKKSLRIENDCEIPDGSVGVSGWRGLARQNGVGVQVLSVHFGTCTAIFARILHGSRGDYSLIGDVGLPLGGSAMVFYSRFGSDVQIQVGNLVTLVSQNGLPMSNEIASISPLSGKN